MKLKQYFRKLNKENFINFTIGNIRYYVYLVFPILIRPKIKQIFNERKAACPECLENGEAICCGCETPQVFFAPKGCKFNKYPPIK